MVVLEAHDVTKTFKEGREEVAVLRGASIELSKGEIVSLEGPSGSGKTTFLSILGCILTPTSGEVAIEGAPVDPKRLAEIRRKSIGFVFQQFNLFPALTAVENVEFALNVKRVKGEVARKEAERVLDAVGLGDRKDFLPRDLSGGQKQRVAIARAIYKDPAVLILDEATSSLDSESESYIREALDRFVKGRTTFVIAHRLATVERADHIIVLDYGRIEAIGTHRELVDKSGVYRNLYQHQFRPVCEDEPAAPDAEGDA